MSTATEHNEFQTSTGVLWDDPESGQTWLVTIISVIILAGLVIFLSVVYFQGEHAEVTEKVTDKANVPLVTMVADQKAKLSETGAYKVDVAGKEVTRQRIPIAQAMERLSADPALAVPPPGAKKSAAPAPK